MYCHLHSARNTTQRKCPECLWFQDFAKHLKEIVTQVGIVIHFLQLETCGMNINKGIQASQLKQVLLVDEVDQKEVSIDEGDKETIITSSIT